MSGSMNLTVRILRGDPITNRGKRALPGFEVLFTVKDGMRVMFAPYSVNKPYEDFLQLYNNLRDLDIGKGCKHDVESPFPPESEDKEVLKDPSKISPADIEFRLKLITVWINEVLELIGQVVPPLQGRFLATVSKFMEISAPKEGEIPKPDDAAKAAMRECLISGYHNVVKAGRQKNYARKSKPVTGLKRFVLERVEIDTFEQRYSADTGYYLYNPYTGECISDMQTSDRSHSTWLPPDPHLDVRDQGGAKTVMQTLYEHWYASRHYKRRWQRGIYASDPHKAAVVLTALARGFLQRRHMRLVHRARYHKMYDSHNKCCYFLDLWTSQTSWYKPLLAHPYSIQPPPPDLRPDQVPFSGGPLVQTSFGKGTSKVPKKPLQLEQAAALTEREPEVIDLNLDFLLVSMWMDDNVKKLHKMAPLWTCYQNNDWRGLFTYLLTYIEDELVVFFSCHAFGRMEIPLQIKDDGSNPTEPTQMVRKVMNYLFTCLHVWSHSRKYGCNIQMAVANALLHIYEHHLCRLAFFYSYESRLESVLRLMTNATSGKVEIPFDDIEEMLNEDLDAVQLEDEQKFQDIGFIEARIEHKLNTFCTLLRNIPVEITQEQFEKGIHGNVTNVARPTRRAAEFVLIIFKIIGVLAHERDTRECVGMKCSQTVAQTLRTCIEDQWSVQFGLRCMYNFMYMCFEGWRWVKMECDIDQLMTDLKKSAASGDEVVARELRRVELSLEVDGWRGHVEKKIGEELLQNNISVYLRKNSSENNPIKEENAVIGEEIESETPEINTKRKRRAKVKDNADSAKHEHPKPVTTAKSALIMVE